jgi:hypothetical protein
MGEHVCTFCESTDVVLISGYKYCQKCSIVIDQAVLEDWVQQILPTIAIQNVRKLLTDMFGTAAYSFAQFPRLYVTVPRGKWDKVKGYAVSQFDYIKECARLHIISFGANYV